MHYKTVKRCSGNGDFGAVCGRGEVCEYDSVLRMNVCRNAGPLNICVNKGGEVNEELRQVLHAPYCDTTMQHTPSCVIYSCKHADETTFVEIKSTLPGDCENTNKFHFQGMTCTPYRAA